MGHAGTLDPQASGVLLIALGQATRVLEFLSEAPKGYWAVVELGVATETYDAEGKVTENGDYSVITRDGLASVLSSFLGPIQQTPPMFSALKRGGVPLYRLARSGVTVDRPSREVTIHRLDMLDWSPPLLTLNIECSKGTYIRSLAHDIGQSLGCGAHLKTLARWRIGPFHIQDAVTLPELEAGFKNGGAYEFIRPLDTALLDKLAAIVGGEKETALRNGRSVDFGAESLDISAKAAEHWCRGYSREGEIVALLRLQPGTSLWHPRKVFGPKPSTPASA